MPTPRPLGGPDKLERLSVQFRGMGVMEEEVVVTGTVREVDGDRAIVDSQATQSGKRIIRNGEADDPPVAGAAAGPSGNLRGPTYNLEGC